MATWSIRAGDWVKLDPKLFPCADPSYTALVRQDECGNLYFFCEDGMHRVDEHPDGIEPT